MLALSVSTIRAKSVMVYAKLILRKLEAKLNSFSNPFLETLQSCKTKDVLIGIVLFLAAFSAFASLSTEALINGDAALYVQQMQNLDFAERTVHIGYYLLGAGFIHIFPGSDDYVLNLMACFYGALSIMLIYLITFIICHRHIPAIISGLFLLTHYIFLENSVYAEVYTPRTCFLLMAILWWLLNRPILAGVSFALSFLIAPSAVFALPLFFILRPRLRPLLLFCVVILVITVPLILPVYGDYFFGPRGLLQAAQQPFSLGWALRKEGWEIFISFFLCIPFLVVGLVEIFGRKSSRPLGIALLTLWITTLFLGEKFPDLSPQLPTYALLCLVGGLGLNLFFRIPNSRLYATILSAVILFCLTVVVILIKTTKILPYVSAFLPGWFLAVMVSCAVLCILAVIVPRLSQRRAQVIIVSAAIFALVINGFVAFAKIKVVNKYHTEYRNTMIEMGKLACKDYLVIGRWGQRILFEHYVFGKSYTPYCTCINVRMLNGAHGRERQAAEIKELNEAIAARRQMWLLEDYSDICRVLRQAGYKIAPFGRVYPVYVATVPD